MAVRSDMTSLGPGGIERRRHPRINVGARARVSLAGAAVGDLELRDISVGGAFLSGGEAPPLGSVLDIEITSGLLAGARLRAEIVRHQTVAGGMGMGVRFCDAESHIAQMMQNVVLAELEKNGGTSP
jgi:hypothetical protein